MGRRVEVILLLVVVGGGGDSGLQNVVAARPRWQRRRWRILCGDVAGRPQQPASLAFWHILSPARPMLRPRCTRVSTADIHVKWCTAWAHGCVGALDEMVTVSVYRFVYAWLSASRVGVGPKERAYVCVCVCALD